MNTLNASSVEVIVHLEEITGYKAVNPPQPVYDDV